MGTHRIIQYIHDIMDLGTSPCKYVPTKLSSTHTIIYKSVKHTCTGDVFISTKIPEQQSKKKKYMLQGLMLFACNFNTKKNFTK